MSLRPLYAGAAIIIGFSCAVHAASSTPSAKDFVKKASIGSQFEIQSSQIALDKSHNSSVQKFAQEMVDDHTEASRHLADALEDSAVKVEPADDVDSTHAKMIARLDAASDGQFDKEYIAMQTKAHKQAVALFSDYAAHGKDPALKQFASATLPTLKVHLKHAQALSTK